MNTKNMVRNAAFDYFMPLVILWRYMTAPDGAKTISIERPERRTA